MKNISQNVIDKVNSILDDMIPDKKFTLLRYHLKKLRLMPKDICDPEHDLNIDIILNVLFIPDYVLDLPNDAIKWMLLHEAAHLDNGDDILLRRVAEKLDYVCNMIMKELHNAMELNANLKALKIFNGLPPQVIGDVAFTGNGDKISNVDMAEFYNLIEGIHTLTENTINPLHEKMFQVRKDKQESNEDNKC